MAFPIWAISSRSFASALVHVLAEGADVAMPLVAGALEPHGDLLPSKGVAPHLQPALDDRVLCYRRAEGRKGCAETRRVVRVQMFAPEARGHHLFRCVAPQFLGVGAHEPDRHIGPRPEQLRGAAGD